LDLFREIVEFMLLAEERQESKHRTNSLGERGAYQLWSNGDDSESVGGHKLIEDEDLIRNQERKSSNEVKSNLKILVGVDEEFNRQGDTKNQNGESREQRLGVVMSVNERYDSNLH